MNGFSLYILIKCFYIVTPIACESSRSFLIKRSYE